MILRGHKFRVPGGGDLSVPVEASMNGTLMCLVGLLHLLQVRPLFTLQKAPLPYRHPHHHSRRAHRSGASKQAAPNSRTSRNTNHRPNAFVSIRLPSPTVRASIEHVQEEMQRSKKGLKSAMVSLDKLHLTLMVLRLDTKEEESRAIKVLHEVTSKISVENSFDGNPMRVSVKGIGSFGDRVVFAKIAEEERLRKMADFVRSKFDEAGLPTTDKRPFNPHLTIAKSSKFVRSIPSSAYDHLPKDMHFGEDSVDSLELLSMSKPVDEAGYYYCFAKISF